MIITQHKEGGIYFVHFTGKMKMEDGRWDEAVVYQRAPILLKPGEKTDETYVRSKTSFKENFKLLTIEEFRQIPEFENSLLDFPFRPTFSGIFG